MNRQLKFFKMTGDYVFGKEYIEKEKEGYIQCLDSLLKPKDSKKEESGVGTSKNIKSDNEGVSF